MRREDQAGIADGQTHAVAALANGRIREPDHDERGQTERHVHLYLNGKRLDPEDGGGLKTREHAASACKRRDARKGWQIRPHRPEARSSCDARRLLVRLFPPPERSDKR